MNRPFINRVGFKGTRSIGKAPDDMNQKDDVSDQPKSARYVQLILKV